MFMLVEESRKRTQEEFHTQNFLLINEINERQKTEKLLSEAKRMQMQPIEQKPLSLRNIS